MLELEGVRIQRKHRCSTKCKDFKLVLPLKKKKISSKPFVHIIQP